MTFTDCKLVRTADAHIKLVVPEEAQLVKLRLGDGFVVESDMDCVCTSYILRVTVDNLMPKDIDESLLPQISDGKGYVAIPILHLFTNNTLCLFERNCRHFKALDSSIWNYSVVADDKEQLKSVLERIFHNWEEKLYLLEHSLEYADLKARLARDSYIVGDAHGNDIRPFIFHSESDARKTLVEKLKNEKRLTRDGEKFCSGFRWRFLLLDDHACTPLSSKTVTDGPSKLDVIVDRLLSINDIKLTYRNSMGGWSYKSNSSASTNDNEYDIAIDYVTSIDEMMKKLENGRYDIILLDYLLGRVTETHQREYSYDIFKKIRGYIGPFGRPFFMFISSYVYAIQERLEAEHIYRNDSRWFIGRGACPLNTPEIFLLNLHQIMKRRIDDFRVFDLNSVLGDKSKEVDILMRNSFGDLLKFIERFDTVIDNDLSATSKGKDGKESVLARSIIEKYGLVSDKSFWEHLRHLCYMIAYEPRNRWPEWWEEYVYIRGSLPKAVAVDKAGNEIIDIGKRLGSFISEVSKEI